MAIELRKVYVCEQCGYDWLPISRDWTQLPNICPKCKTPRWNGSKLAKKKEREIQERRDVISEEW